MRKVKRLMLGKETVRKLTGAGLRFVHGGWTTAANTDRCDSVAAGGCTNYEQCPSMYVTQCEGLCTTQPWRTSDCGAL